MGEVIELFKSDPSRQIVADRVSRLLQIADECREISVRVRAQRSPTKRTRRLESVSARRATLEDEIRRRTSLGLFVAEIDRLRALQAALAPADSPLRALRSLSHDLITAHHPECLELAISPEAATPRSLCEMRQRVRVRKPEP